MKKKIIIILLFSTLHVSSALAAPSTPEFDITYKPSANNISALNTLKNEFSDVLSQFMEDMKSTSLFSLPQTTIGDVTGDSVITFTSYTQEFSFDFASWPSTVFLILRGVFMATALFSCIKIIGKGSTV